MLEDTEIRWKSLMNQLLNDNTGEVLIYHQLSLLNENICEKFHLRSIFLACKKVTHKFLFYSRHCFPHLEAIKYTF